MSKTIKIFQLFATLALTVFYFVNGNSAAGWAWLVCSSHSVEDLKFHS